jgi:hypothetical protein
MSIVTMQQLTRYYEQYRTTDVTFNKQVISAVGLVPKGVYLKILDRQIPCMVFSSSMSAARVIASVSASVMAAFKQANNRLALRWCFKLPDKVEPMTFFVTCKPTGFTHYAVQGPDVHFVALEFTQRPPDDLILILGSLLEAQFNSQKRKDERIIVSPDTMKKLGLESREAALVVDGRERKCILRDLSFSGAKVVVSGKAEAFANRTMSLRLVVGDQSPEITLPATVRRVDEVGGRRDILTVSIEYSSDTPMSYKLLINSYVSTIRKAAQDAAQAPAGAAAATSAVTEAGPTDPWGAETDADATAEPAAGSPGRAPADIPAEADPLDDSGGRDPEDA